MRRRNILVQIGHQTNPRFLSGAVAKYPGNQIGGGPLPISRSAVMPAGKAACTSSTENPGLPATMNSQTSGSSAAPCHCFSERKASAPSKKNSLSETGKLDLIAVNTSMV